MKKNAKKLLSIFLSIVMIVSCVSVSFTTFAAGSATNAQWNALVDALKNDTVANAGFGGSTNNYTVNDPDGKILAAVDAYWSVFESYGAFNLSGSESNSKNAYRTINMVNSSIINELKTKMGGDFATYNTQSFINSLVAGTSVSSETTTSSLSAAPTVKITVNITNALQAYPDVVSLPDQVTTSKAYAVNHNTVNYKSGGFLGIGAKTYNYYTLSSKSTSEGKASTQSIKDAQTVLEANAAVFTDDMSALIALGNEKLGSAKADVQSAYNNVVNMFGVNVWNHFFPNNDVAAAVKNIDEAISISAYIDLAKEIKDLCATDYSEYDLAQLQELYNVINTKLDSYKATSSSTKEYLESQGYNSIEQTEAVLQSIKNEIDLFVLKQLKAEIDNHMKEYGAYSLEEVESGSLTSAMLTAALVIIQSDIDKLNDMDDSVIEEVCGSGYTAKVIDVKNSLTYLAGVAGYNDKFAQKYNEFSSQIKASVDVTADSEALRGALKNADGWYAELKAFLSEMTDVLGEDTANALYKGLNDEMTAYMESAYNTLYTRVKTQIDDTDKLYRSIKEAYGEKVTMASLESYKHLKDTVGLIDTDTYNYLKDGTANFTLDSETIAKYESFAAIIDSYLAFKDSKGLDDYTKYELPEIVRKESEKDVVRVGDYTVTDETVEKVIALLDKALQNEDIKALLGFDLGETLNGALDSLYSDNIINSIITALYPAVGLEFAKAWADLPESMTIKDVDTGILGMKADVTAGLDLYTVEKATSAVGLNIFPVELGKYIEANFAQYADVAEAMKQVTTSSNYDRSTGEFTNPWNDDALYTIDENGNRVMNLKWNITDRASFIDAAVAALSGLEPILLALVSNIAYQNSNESSDYRGAKIGTGSGSAKVLGINLNLQIDPISLIFNCSANDGYDNALAPIFEALGLENIPHGETLTSTRKILEDGLFAMVDQLLDKVAANPVDTIVSILPTLCYALEGDMVTDLLSMLKTDITYSADAKYSVIGIVNGEMKDAMVSEAPILVNVADMINLEDLGVDLSSFSGLWNMVTDMLGQSIPCPEAGKVATMGDLVWNDTNRSEKTYSAGPADKAAHINANKADVLVYLVQFVLKNDILSSFIDTSNMAEAVKTIFANLAENSDDSIAAVAELLNQIEYPLTQYNWYDGSYGGTSSDLVSAKDIYLTYNSNWTKETAEYVTENLDDIVASIVKLTGSDLDLSALIKNGIDSLFTNANLTKLAKLLGGIVLDEKLSNLIKNQVGIDLSAWNVYADLADDYNWGFEDGNRKAFAKALVSLLSPLDSVLDFILNGEDITLLDGDVKLIGYNGYDSAFVPLLEALGCDVKALAKDDNALEAVIDALLNKLAQIEVNPIEEIINLLPGVLYYLASDALTVGVKNLLQPIHVILDTIRPIYDVDLNSILSGLTKNLGVNINLDDLGITFVVDLLSGLSGLDLSNLKSLIYDVCKVIGVPYTSESSLIGENGVKGAYTEGLDKSDMLTVVLSAVLKVFENKSNEEPLTKLLGAGAYKAISNMFDMQEVPMQEMSYINTQYADTDHVFSAFETSVLFDGQGYGPLYTADKAQYIADNIDDFIDNLIYLLGVEINGKNVNSLADLLNGLVNGNLYNSTTAQSILDAIKGLIANLDNLDAIEHIKAVLDKALNVDLSAWNSMKIEAFDNDRDKFTSALCDILQPLIPVLKWALSDEDITFFADENNEKIITLKGAEGYAYGIIPVLEALGCEDILSTEEYYSAVENDENVLLTSILNPLFNRLEVIMENPADEILSMLPNVIYFINSNGLDTCFKNAINSVYTVLNAIEPIAKVDLYDVMGIRLDEITFESLFNMLLELISTNTGYDFSSLSADAIEELTVGKLVSYTSANGLKAYKMIYQSNVAKAEMVTVVLRLLVTFIMHDNNREALIGLLKDKCGMSETAEKYVRGVLEAIATYTVSTKSGMDKALVTLYYIYFGVDTGVDHTATGLKKLNEMWQQILKNLGKSDDPNEVTVGNLIAKILDELFEDVFDSNGLASNGLIAFFQKIFSFFQKLIDFFKNLVK